MVCFSSFLLSGLDEACSALARCVYFWFYDHSHLTGMRMLKRVFARRHTSVSRSGNSILGLGLTAWTLSTCNVFEHVH